VEAGAATVPGGDALRAGAKVIAAGLAAGLLGVLVLIFLVGGGGCPVGAGRAAAPTRAALNEIPASYLRLYEEAGQRYAIAWPFLAGIGWIESRHGQDPLARQVNPSGCVGPMELGIGGECGDFVGEWGVDGNGDGHVDPRTPADAIFTAAHGLRDGKDLPALGSATEADYYQAACGYYGACAGYADIVLQRAADYGGPDWLMASGEGGGIGCAAAQDGTGTVRIARGANRPGVPLTAATLSFLRRVAGIVGHPITVTTGSNHSKYTVDGLVSDHWDGHAADFGITANGGVAGGDAICAAGLIAAGDSSSKAAAECRSGGLYTRYHEGLRIQVIWKTYEGGDHFDHVHIGARPT
jgi:hypothetical protein